PMRSKESVSGQLTNDLATDPAAQLDAYASLILASNQKAGLMSSGTSRDDLYQRHFPESFAVLAALESNNLLNSPVIDIGSGAGLPGVPLKIARPGIGITLLEATQKKAAFLGEVVQELRLTDVTVIRGRAEEIGRDPLHRERYRLAVARSVAPLPVLLELALPLLAVGGVLAAVKGSRMEAEIDASANALATLGGAVEVTLRLEIPLPGPPMLVIVRKVAETPDAFPRRPGMPNKRPL
ncbi:MAG: 16S rRNA (guanine(527)-N(7))-methyltransferase RsmG, partial [Dehalococcoidia bacterium]